jgi:CelD/BcsL family acetyltransferase involved in cellulose biosynthesis
VVRGGPEVIDQFSKEWEAMCDGNPDMEPFCRPEWTRAYCRALAPKSRLVLISARVDGELKAVLPLIEENTLFYGLPARKLTGAASFFYRFDISGGSNPDKKAAIQAVWQALKELGHWDVIEFPQTPHGAEIETLLCAAQEEGYRTGSSEGVRNAYIPVAGWDGDPDYWLLRCNRHFRHTFRTAARKLPAGAEVSLRRVTKADPDSLRAFYALESSGWKGEEGTAIDCSDDTRQFFTEIAEAAARSGYFSMYFLDVNGVPIAAHFALTLGGKCYALKCAYDQKYSACAPGHLIVNSILRDCAERGLSDFEFLGPMSEWKSKWTSLFHQLAFSYVFPNSAYGRMLHSAKFKLAAGVKDLLTG